MATYYITQDGTVDYTTLEAAVENGGTIDNDIFVISGSWTGSEAEGEDTQITVDDIITIIATGSARHAGVQWTTGDTHYKHRNSSVGHSITLTSNKNLTIDGLDLQNTSTGVSDECISIVNSSNSSDVTLTNCIFGFSTPTDQQDIVYGLEFNGTILFENCIFYNAYRAIIDNQNDGFSGGFTGSFNSCTIFNSVYGAQLNLRFGIIGTVAAAYPESVKWRVFNTLIGLRRPRTTTTVFSGTGGPYATMSMAYCITDTGTAYGSGDDDPLNDWVIPGEVWQAAVSRSEFINNYPTMSFVSDVTGSGVYVAFTDMNGLGTGPYDLTLVDSANNFAKGLHSVSTFDGLTMPEKDIKGNTRSIPYSVGAIDFTSSAAAATISYAYFRRNQYYTDQTMNANYKSGNYIRTR